MEKSVGKGHGIFEIKSIGDEVQLTEVNPFKDDYVDVSIELQTFLQKWSAYKSDLPGKVQGDWAARCVSPRAPIVSVDIARAKLMVALAGAAVERNSRFVDQVYLCYRPSAVRAAVPLKKEELRIVPLCPIGSISTTKGADCIDSGRVVGAESTKLYLNKWAQPKDPAVAAWKAD